MTIRSLAFRTDVAVLEAGGSTVEDRGDHLVVRTPENPGFWWGNFLLWPSPPTTADVTRWNAAFEAAFPGAGHRAHGLDTTDGHAGDPAALAALGLAADHGTVLTSVALGPPRPVEVDGAVEVRPLSGDADWDLALRLRHSWDPPRDPAERVFGERRVAGHRALCESGHAVWFGAFVGGRLRSACGIFPDGHGAARYQLVETDPAARRTGLAGAVVHHAGRHALALPGVERLIIVADPGYHAIGLYRALGFTDTERQVQLQAAPPLNPVRTRAAAARSTR